MHLLNVDSCQAQQICYISTRVVIWQSKWIVLFPFPNLPCAHFFFFLIFPPDTLSSRGIPYLTVNLVKGDMLYIPQMWWQHVTFSTEYNLFVQFLWPSKTAITSGNLQSSTQIRGKK